MPVRAVGALVAAAVGGLALVACGAKDNGGTVQLPSSPSSTTAPGPAPSTTLTIPGGG